MKLRKLPMIRDPLYDWIPFSKVETKIIDERLLQRLRHISQNGFVHLTFPSNRTHGSRTASARCMPAGCFF